MLPTITVNYATEDGTAIAANDYTSINGTLTFDPGEINKIITVPILGDNMLEENETVYLNLSQSDNANLTDSQATATIINQDMSNNPTDLNLSNSRIREHQPIETMIGEFITTDPDTGNTFTYTLVSGDGSTDNNLFTIENNQLKTNASFDYETKNFYNIRVRTTDQDGLSFEKALIIDIDNINEASLPVITNPISDVAVPENAQDTNINLLDHFDDPLTTGKLAQFELYNTELAGGVINVLLFDQAEGGAPLTVENFINYAEDDDYVNSIIHRSIPGFVVQGGGFIINNLTLEDVPSDSPVQNEFSSDRSNLRGTIAMAKLGGDPDSATNQWFFNLEDNASNLDNQNGGFTVFGEVLAQNDLAVIDAIGNVLTRDATTIDPAFSDIPLLLEPDDLRIEDDNEFVRFRNITIGELDELSFSVVNNSNPSLVDVSIDNNQLIVDYVDEQTGTAEITIRGTSLLGYTVEDTFNINVDPNNEPQTVLIFSNSFEDIIDENDNVVSLREAIIDANNANSDTTITLEEGTYVLGIEGKNEDSSATGDLDITQQDHTITIQGQGKDKTILNANGLDRFLEIHTGANVILSDVTITGGLASVGGAIANRGTLTLINSDLENNQAMGNDGTEGSRGSNSSPDSFDNPRRGGAGDDGSDGEDALGGAIFNSGTITITNSEISTNQAIAGDGGSGGEGGTGSNASSFGAPFAPGAGGHGGDGGDGGDAQGGGIYNSGEVTRSYALTDSPKCEKSNSRRRSLLTKSRKLIK